MTRTLCRVVALLVVVSSLAYADLKIKTRTTVQGHATESTVYIKGPRERREMAMGGRGSTAIITQCDQKRMITVMGNECMVMSMGGGESSCPSMPSMGSMMRGAMGGEPSAPRKGGVVTITHTANDTGERQDMFGYKARHIKSSMVMESSPDACNQSHMKMEIDGWYADIQGFACAAENYRQFACGGPGSKPNCSDRIVMKGSGAASLGYPLKQIMTITSDQGSTTMTQEVLEISSTTLDAPLFDMPPGCHVMDTSALTRGAAAPPHEEAPAPAAPAPAAKPVAAAAPAPAPVAPKGAGTVRVGVVKIKDMSGQSLPVDNLRLNLMAELERNKMEAVPLNADAPFPDVVTEAQSKQCDYILFTVPSTVADPNTGGVPAASLPKGIKLDPSRYQALSAMTLYKVDKPEPEVQNFVLAADANQFGVDAVMATFVLESDKVAQQVADDAHPKAAAKTTKTPAKAAPKAGTAATKPK